MCLLRTALTNTSRSSAVSVSAVRSFTTTRTALAQSSAEKDPQLGDYPQLPYVSLQSRKWSPKWWDPQEKRNYGETLHEQDDALAVWAPDVHAVRPGSALTQFLVAAGVAATFGTLVYAFTPERPALPRTYPRDGLATELGGSQVAAAAEGAFSQSDDEEEEDDE